MIYYGGNDYRDYLAHYGVLGMKWGIRRYQPYSYTGARKGGKTGKEIGIARKLSRSGDSNSAVKNKYLEPLYKAKTKNIEKWGNDSDHNILYLTGLSGSGKSTTANELAKHTNSEVIHLDAYLSPMSEESKKELQSSSFNKMLDKEVPDWKK